MAGSTPLRVRLDQLVGRDAILTPIDAARPSLSVDKQFLPKSSAVGDEFVVEFVPVAEAAEQRDVVARKLLEDILNGK